MSGTSPGTDLVRNVARHGLAGLTVVLQAARGGRRDLRHRRGRRAAAAEIYNRVLELFRAKYGLDGRQDTENRVIFNLTTSSLTTV